MSTGAGCHFIEKKPCEWYYKLQCHPYGETEESDEFGPFSTLEIGLNHLHDNHANPGGFHETTYDEIISGEIVEELQTIVKMLQEVKGIDYPHLRKLTPGAFGDMPLFALVDLRNLLCNNLRIRD